MIQIVIQVLGQIVAVTLIRRYRPDIRRPFRMWAYRCPASRPRFSGSWCWSRRAPPLWVWGCWCWLWASVVYMLRARRVGEWPFPAGWRIVISRPASHLFQGRSSASGPTDFHRVRLRMGAPSRNGASVRSAKDSSRRYALRASAAGSPARTLTRAPKARRLPPAPARRITQVAVSLDRPVPEERGAGVDVVERQVQRPVAVEVGRGRSPADCSFAGRRRSDCSWKRPFPRLRKRRLLWRYGPTEGCWSRSTPGKTCPLAAKMSSRPSLSKSRKSVPQPTKGSVGRSSPGPSGDVGEVEAALIAVQRVVFLGKMRDVQREAAAVEKIPDRDAHPGLFDAVAVEGRA